MFHLIYTFSPQENLHSLTLRTGPTALITSETHNEDRYRCEMRMENGDSMQVTTIYAFIFPLNLHLTSTWFIVYTRT